jgi:ribonucleoside-triphosphate reductase
MAERQVLEKRLGELRAELREVKGGPTEVYSRIVGYYRSVRNWNAGKREEFDARLTFRMPQVAAGTAAHPARTAPTAPGTAPTAPGTAPMASPAIRAAARAVETAPDGPRRGQAELEGLAPSGLPPAGGAGPTAAEKNGLLVFTRKACPNCPPVAAWLGDAGLPALFIDVDGEDGLALARRHSVMATPTVLGLDGEGREAFRAYGLAELREKLPGGSRGTC